MAPNCTSHPTPSRTSRGSPDLLIAFDVDPEAYRHRNAYIISEQGKPPDFVLEVASPSTGRIDVSDKPADYAALGIPLEGYSEVLELYLRWERGQLQWHDPETGRAIMNLAEMQRIAEEERQGRLAERQARLEAERREEVERQARLKAEQARSCLH